MPTAMPCSPAVYLRGKEFAPMLSFAQGPHTIGVTGDGSAASLFGYAWAACIDASSRRLRLFQYQLNWQPYRLASSNATSGYAWVEKQIDNIDNSGAVRRVSLAFDHSAQPVIAHERTGSIWVRQWNQQGAGFVFHGPYSGVDPILFNDAIVNGNIADSDVQLYYLSIGRDSIISRLERDAYDTEYAVVALPATAYLDQVVAGPLLIELLGSYTSHPDSAEFAVISGLYPVFAAISIVLSGDWTEGEYKEVLKRAHSAMVIALAGDWTEGEYKQNIISVNSPMVIVLSGDWTEGEYKEVLKRAHSAMVIALAGDWTGGEYKEILTKYNMGMTMTLTGDWTGGTYEQP